MKRVAGRLGLGLALATCILAGYGAWLQLSSPLLPGPLAPYSVMLLQELRGSMRPFSQGPSTLLAFALYVLAISITPLLPWRGWQGYAPAGEVF